MTDDESDTKVAVPVGWKPDEFKVFNFNFKKLFKLIFIKSPTTM